MATLQAIVGNMVYPLSDGSPFIWTGEDNVGMAPVRRIVEQGPLQYGDSDIDFRLSPRIFRESFLLSPATLADHYTQRALALKVFRPSNTPIRLRWFLDNGAIRQIDCQYVGGVTNGAKEREGFTQKLVAELRAADPTFYDPTMFSIPFSLGGGSGGFTVPIAVPMAVGASTLNTTTTITYNGTWRSFPVVVIVGPITDPVITNTTTAEKLDFTGITIAAAQTFTIDCRYGYKTVVDQAGTNRIAALTINSDLATFHLDADPEASGGLNAIRVTGTGVTGATTVYLRYYERFLGI